ncbi:MAG: phytanoyl-CoA dioxygenase family protein, partial [Leptolyngbyaceae cyanobacterium CSU_1_3]|nr:phytanoyl-CoA dioxygenase family protein [Leptolyngbyaceae cyanobacterium CSU_1_3]
MTVQVALSDIDELAHGPTQYVPTSHYSGRKPNATLEFDGHAPQSVFCKAGAIYLTNHQTWHRGAPNLSERVRYIMQIQYAQHWADRRFRG